MFWYVTWVYIRQIKEDDLSKKLKLFFLSLDMNMSLDTTAVPPSDQFFWYSFWCTYEYFIHMSIRIVFNPYRADCFGIFFYFSFCLLLYCMVLYLDALVGGCYCQKWPSKNVNSYNWLLVVIKGLFIGFEQLTFAWN